MPAHQQAVGRRGQLATAPGVGDQRLDGALHARHVEHVEQQRVFAVGQHVGYRQQPRCDDRNPETHELEHDYRRAEGIGMGDHRDVQQRQVTLDLVAGNRAGQQHAVGDTEALALAAHAVEHRAIADQHQPEAGVALRQRRKRVEQQV